MTQEELKGRLETIARLTEQVHQGIYGVRGTADTGLIGAVQKQAQELESQGKQIKAMQATCNEARRINACQPVAVLETSSQGMPPWAKKTVLYGGTTSGIGLIIWAIIEYVITRLPS